MSLLGTLLLNENEVKKMNQNGRMKWIHFFFHLIEGITFLCDFLFLCSTMQYGGGWQLARYCFKLCEEKKTTCSTYLMAVD